MKIKKWFTIAAAFLLAVNLMLTGCSASAQTNGQTRREYAGPAATPEERVSSGFITEQILQGAEGDIHYSYYLPEGYDENRSYPLMMVMPGYDMMWFGEQSSGSNLRWNGFRAWTELDEDLIVVSAQLTDWHKKSARQAIELTEYFIQNFTVDESRIYAAGYSAGGETMSQAVSLRPDLYAAYLHGASQWDGEYAPLAEQRVAVYIFMAENDEYYGSQKARSAYENLLAAYQKVGLSSEEIGELLKLEIPGNDYFAQRGIRSNYHGGGNVLFDDETILNWVISARKEQANESTGFSDVPPDAWYADAVAYVQEQGLMGGVSDTVFNPYGNVTRGQLAAILYRMAGSPDMESEIWGYPFSDVDAASYYATPIYWTRLRGLMSGYSDERFAPGSPVTREQLAVILWRSAGCPDSTSGQDFMDENMIASYASAAVDWARAEGVISGTSDNRFAPKSTVTRAQIAVILQNYATIR